MWAQHKKSNGFTIVELLVTIVIVGMLAALVAINYNSVQTKTKATNEMSDLKELNRAIQAYYAENSAYPVSYNSDWVGWGQQTPFIDGLTPKFIAKQPQQKDTSSGSGKSYIYRSDGTNYKLISHAPGDSVCATAVGITPAMADIVRNCWAFGIWSEGAKWW